MVLQGLNRSYSIIYAHPDVLFLAEISAFKWFPAMLDAVFNIHRK